MPGAESSPPVPQKAELPGHRRRCDNGIYSDVPRRRQRLVGPKDEQQCLVIAPVAHQLQRAEQTQEQKNFELHDRALPEEWRLELIDIAHQPVRAQIFPYMYMKLPAIRIDERSRGASD